MSRTWHRLSLGDGITATLAIDRIELAFAHFIQHTNVREAAIFKRLDSASLHCEVTAYFSPAAADLARQFGARPCVRPAREGLELIAGDLGRSD